jgi:thiosulfate/3-mercaptopyruvate sulfurtransferase
MPHALSLPFSDLVQSAPGGSYTILREPPELLSIVESALGTPENTTAVLKENTRQVVNSCGSGMTAGVLWLALQELGVESAIYDEVRRSMKIGAKC